VASPQHALTTHGWIPDPDDARDLTIEHPRPGAARLPWEKRVPREPPERVDLREWFPPVVDQGNAPICTAATVAGIAAYLAKREHDASADPSILFNYRVSRTLSGQPDRQGSLLRYAMSAWALCGTLEERYWPFDLKAIDADPSPFCYSVAHNYRSVSYFRIDHTAPRDEYLSLLKRALARGLPVTLGIHLYPSLVQSFASGVLPVPASTEQSLGGHAVLLVGYDDAMAGAEPPGALLIRNSWGQEWGDAGYGWLPYGWILGGHAKDSWSVVKDDWVDLEAFDPSPPDG
jgi:C1A family cysteine protease